MEQIRFRIGVGFLHSLSIRMAATYGTAGTVAWRRCWHPWHFISQIGFQPVARMAQWHSFGGGFFNLLAMKKPSTHSMTQLAQHRPGQLSQFANHRAATLGRVALCRWWSLLRLVSFHLQGQPRTALPAQLHSAGRGCFDASSITAAAAHGTAAMIARR